MISCPHCEGNHRDSERVEICGIRLQRRLERAERQEADRARRWKNALEQTPWDYIHWRRRTGDHWDRIVAALNRDYPPPAPGRRYDLMLVVQLGALDLNWPGVSTETKTLMLLERYMLGAFVSVHPLELKSIHDSLAGSVDPGTLWARLSRPVELEPVYAAKED